jgi:hypothetical protein
MGPSSLMLDYLQAHSSFSVTHPPIYGRPSKFVAHANLAWNMISKGINVEKLDWSTGIAQQSEGVQLQFLEEFKSLLTQRIQLSPDDKYDPLLLSAIEETYFL